MGIYDNIIYYRYAAKEGGRMAKPMFVVGAHRSGTTWLGNLLCRHREIAGVQAKEHQGIHESVFFSHVAEHFGDLQNENDFIEFVEAFSSSDYYKLTGLDKEFLYRQRPKGYGECFRLIMDSFAEKEGAEYWVEKSPVHTLYLSYILENFPEATVFGMKRDIIHVLESTLKLWAGEHQSGLGKMFEIGKLLLRYTLYNKYLSHYASEYENVRIIKFSEMKNETKLTAEKIVETLGLQFESKLLRKKYEPNTSFESGKDDEANREEILPRSTRWSIILLYGTINKFPFSIYQIIENARRFRQDNVLPNWFWKIYREEVL